MTNKNSTKVAIIGAGLAGSEAALVLARNNIYVDLYEMRPVKMTEAHETGNPGELVCSNSFKSTELPTAHGLLKAELELLDSPLIRLAKKAKVPAGSALAVNREEFSGYIQEQIEASEYITYKTMEVTEPPTDADYTVIATGPLTSGALAEWIQKEFSQDSLNFYDAIAPIIDFDSVDMSKAFFASRWGKGDADYLNCPFTEEEYKEFYDALIEADQVKKREFEDSRFFEACLPLEVVAGRGYNTLCFGMMKPVGLPHPETGEEYFAVCQLRKENKQGDSFNMVGCQTRMTFSEQKRIFRMIPGLEKAEFIRYGTIHRNSYLNSPELLNRDLSFKSREDLFLVGQLSGNEGYTESVTTGHLAALSILSRINNDTIIAFPSDETACGALLDHITRIPEKGVFTPTNINFSLVAAPPPGRKMRKKDKKAFYCERALRVMKEWIA